MRNFDYLKGGEVVCKTHPNSCLVKSHVTAAATLTTTALLGFFSLPWHALVVDRAGHSGEMPTSPKGRPAVFSRMWGNGCSNISPAVFFAH